MKSVVIACVISSLLIISLQGATNDQFELVILDSSTNESGAYGINNHGFVSGYRFENGKATPYIWSPSGGYLSLPQLQDSVTDTGIAYAINDNFEIGGTYGQYSSGANVYRMGAGTAVVWVFDLEVDDFVPYHIADPGSMVRDISEVGEVAGQESYRAFTRDIYNTANGYSSTLQESICFGINDHGNATGYFISDTFTTTFSPMYIRRESNGSYSRISGASLFGNRPYGVSAGTKINAKNQIVGIGVSGGFYWEPETGSNSFFGSSTACYDINNLSSIVGMTNNRACIWKKNPSGSFSATDLNNLITDTNIVLEKAFGINTHGQIAGLCLNRTTGVRRAFMLTPAKGVQLKLTPSQNELRLCWPSIPDHLYSIRISRDLSEWISLPEYYHAEDLESWVLVPTDEEKMFFQVFDLTP